MGLAKIAKKGDIINMNDFENGINSVGQLFPAPSSFKDYPPPNSEWQGVEKSFQQAGDSIRTAIKEFSDAQREIK